MSLKQDIDEFFYAVREIQSKVTNMRTHYDRVKVAEWVRKLSMISSKEYEGAKIRNDYIQLLKIAVKYGVLHGIFVNPPPPGDLPPLAEAVGAELVRNVSKLPEMGPISPFVCHKSPDGKAIVSIKRMKDDGVMCYLAVDPERL